MVMVSAEFIEKKVPKSVLKYRAEVDLTWISEHWDELRRKYPGMFIAVRERRVVDFDKDRESLEKRVKEKFGDVYSVTMIFIPSKEYKMLI